MTHPASAPWSWSATSGPPRALEQISATGFALFNLPGAVDAAKDPVALARLLFGREPVRYHFTIIQPVDGTRPGAYPRSMVEAKFHIDGVHAGVPAHAQVMVCEQPAESGGEGTLLDTWALLDRIQSRAPEFVDTLFTVPRLIGVNPLHNHFSTTFTLRRGSLVCMQPNATNEDEIGRRFDRWITRSPYVTLPLGRDDVYINDNHRMLHGRRSFSDKRRRLVRILYWFASPLHTPPTRYAQRAARSARRLHTLLADQPGWMREAFGAGHGLLSPEARERLEQAARLFTCLDISDVVPYTRAEDEIVAQEALLSTLASQLSEPVPTQVEMEMDVDLMMALQRITPRLKRRAASAQAGR